MTLPFDTQYFAKLLDTLPEDASWIGQVFVVVFLALLLAFVVKRFLKRLHRLFEQTDNIWDDALVVAVGRPLRLFIWLQGIAFAAHIVGEKTGAPLFDAVDPLRDIGVIVLLAWFLVRLVKHHRGCRRQAAAHLGDHHRSSGDSADPGIQRLRRARLRWHRRHRGLAG